MTQRPKPYVDSTDETAHEAFRSLIRAYGLLNRAMQPFFGQHGISPSQWGVLRVLDRARHGGPAKGRGLAEGGQKRLRMADLSQRLLIRPASVTGVVDRLERQGLLRRCISSSDLRTKEVCLTPAGEGLVNRILSTRHEHVQAVLSGPAKGRGRAEGGLTAKEQKELVALLSRFINRLEIVVNGKQTGRGND